MEWIKFEDGVKRTPQTDPVIAGLAPYAQKANFVIRITSVLRDKFMQLQTIQDLAIQNKIILDGFKLDFDYQGTFEGKPVPYWVIVWSKLLNIGVIVNPPIPSVCLMDYIRDGINKKGMIIPTSPHFSGNAFDVGGRVLINNQLVENIDSVYKLLQQAAKDGLIQNSESSPLIEHGNNCCHCQIIT